MNLQNITHKARKSRTCTQCGRTVHEGELYVRAPRPGTELGAPAEFHEACYRALAGAQQAKV